MDFNMSTIYRWGIVGLLRRKVLLHHYQVAGSQKYIQTQGKTRDNGAIEKVPQVLYNSHPVLMNQ
jgi:hypothetical protein